MENLVGGSGSDVIAGTAAANALYGGDGNDVFYADAGADTYFGEAGTDEVTYADRTEAVTVGIGTYADDGSGADGPATARDNVRTDVENVVGGAGNDSLSGSTAANALRGGPGADTITGGAGADSLFGDDGDDTLYARDSVADAVPNGGTGTDAAQIDSALDTNRTGLEQLLA